MIKVAVAEKDSCRLGNQRFSLQFISLHRRRHICCGFVFLEHFPEQDLGREGISDKLALLAVPHLFPFDDATF